MRPFAFAGLLLLAASLSVRADVVVLKNGERRAGDVTDQGDSFRVVDPAHPQGLVIPKADVRKVFPKPEKILAAVRGDVDRARLICGAQTEAADRGASLDTALAALHDAEVRVSEAIEIYPAEKERFLGALSDIIQARKLCKEGPGRAPAETDPASRTDEAPAKTPERKPAVKEAPSEIVLVPPAGTVALEADRALKVMLARLQAHGFEGIRGEIDRKDEAAVLRFTCPSGLTPEMQARIAWYGERPGAKLEMRRIVALTEAQQAQFPKPSPAGAAAAPAPKGAKWYVLGMSDTALLADPGAVGWKEFGEAQSAPKRGVYFELAKATAAAIRKEAGYVVKRDLCAGIALVMDGVAFRNAWTTLQYEPEHRVKVEGKETMQVGIVDGVGGGKDKPATAKAPGEKVWLNTGYSEKDWTPIRVAGEHPLPFALAVGE